MSPHKAVYLAARRLPVMFAVPALAFASTSPHRREVKLGDLGALRWSTRSFACFEHAAEGSASRSLRELSRPRRSDLLHKPGATSAA